MGLFSKSYGKDTIFDTTIMSFVQAASELDGPGNDNPLPHDGILDSIFFAIDELDKFSTGVLKDNPLTRFAYYEMFLDQSHSMGYIFPYQRKLRLKKPKPLDSHIEEFLREILEKIRDTNSQEEAQNLGLYVARIFKLLRYSRIKDIKKLVKEIPSDFSDLDNDVVSVAVVLAPSLYITSKETEGLNRQETKFKKEIAIDFAIYFAQTYFLNYTKK